MKKTYHGSCHCKTVTFEADIDVATGTGKCNCTYCWKVRNWSALIKPADLRVLTGESALAAYQMNPGPNKHLFCSRCGVRTFDSGHIPELGGDFRSIPLSTLDDLDPKELLEAPVQFFNGRDNDWFHEPAEKRHL
jgi:hypothetical protein